MEENRSSGTIATETDTTVNDDGKPSQDNNSPESFYISSAPGGEKSGLSSKYSLPCAIPSDPIPVRDSSIFTKSSSTLDSASTQITPKPTSPTLANSGTAVVRFADVPEVDSGDQKRIPRGTAPALQESVKYANDFVMPEHPAQRCLNWIKIPFIVGCKAMDKSEIITEKIFADTTAILLFTLVVTILIYMLLPIPAFMDGRASILIVMIVSASLLLFGYTWHSIKKTKYILDGVIVLTASFLIPVTLFTIKSCTAGYWDTSVFVTSGYCFDFMTSSMVASLAYVIYMGYDRPYCVGFLSVCVAAILGCSIYASCVHVNRSVAIFGEIIAIIYRVLPLFITYYGITSEAYMVRCGNTYVDAQTEEVEFISTRIIHMDFDFLEELEKLCTTDSTGLSKLQEILFTIGKGLREYKAYIPATLFQQQPLEEEETTLVRDLTMKLEDPFGRKSTLARTMSTVSSTSLTKEATMGASVRNMITRFSTNLKFVSSSQSRKEIPLPSFRQTAAAVRRLSSTYNYSRQSISNLLPNVPMLPVPTHSRSTLSVRAVTLVVFQLKGLYDSTTLEVPFWQAVYEAFVDTVDEVVKTEKGVLHSFDSGVIIAHWNAHVSLAGHIRRGCTAACAVIKKFQILENSWKASHSIHLKLIIGITTGPMVCGHTGSSETMRFVVSGLLWTLCHIMSRCNLDLSTRILVTKAVFTDAQFEYRLRSAGYLTIPGLPSLEPFPLYELREPVRSASEPDEWMYELNRGEKSNPFAVYEKAYTEMLQLNWGAAITLFQQHLEQFGSEDMLTEKWIEFCSSVGRIRPPFSLYWTEKLEFHKPIHRKQTTTTTQRGSNATANTSAVLTGATSSATGKALATSSGNLGLPPSLVDIMVTTSVTTSSHVKFSNSRDSEGALAESLLIPQMDGPVVTSVTVGGEPPSTLGSNLVIRPASSLTVPVSEHSLFEQCESIDSVTSLAELNRSDKLYESTQQRLEGRHSAVSGGSGGGGPPSQGEGSGTVISGDSGTVLDQRRRSLSVKSSGGARNVRDGQDPLGSPGRHSTDSRSSTHSSRSSRSFDSRSSGHASPSRQHSPDRSQQHHFPSRQVSERFRSPERGRSNNPSKEPSKSSI